MAKDLENQNVSKCEWCKRLFEFRIEQLHHFSTKKYCFPEFDGDEGGYQTIHNDTIVCPICNKTTFVRILN